MKKLISIRDSPHDPHRLLAFVLTFLLLFPILASTSPTEDISTSYFSPLQNILSADTPKLNLTYSTSTNPTEIVVLSDSMIAGDHIVLRADWSVSVVNKSRLQVIAPAIPIALSVEQNTHIIEIDTRSLGNNATCLINSTAWLTNGSVISKIFQNVHIGNYFVPKVTILTPNGGEVWVGVNTIRWLGSDVNADEDLCYDVRISSDSGVTFETIATSIKQKYYDWNCSSYDKLDTYVVEIRVTDGIYFSSDQSKSPFTAGEQLTNLTTTTTTATSNTTSLIDSRVAIFVAILVITSAVMALAVYYVARRWF